MSSLIKNASPGSIQLGTDDQSKAVIYPTPLEIPQHLPKVYIFGKKGTTNAALVSPDMLTLNYGSETFDINGQYYNHQTKFLMCAAGQANTCMVQRLIPSDVKVKSNFTVYADVLLTEIPNYKRNSFGDYIEDPDTGDYVVVASKPKIPGYMIKFIKEYDTVSNPELGLKTSKPGTMKDGTVTSVMYPIFETVAKNFGKYYDNIGISLSPLYKEDVDGKIVANLKAMPYALSLVTRVNEKSSPVVFRSLYGEPSVTVVLKDKAIDPNTEARIDIEEIFKTQWFNETDSLKELKYEDYAGLYVYRNYYGKIVADIMALEKQYVNSEAVIWDDGSFASTLGWFDFTSADQTELDTETYLINILSCKSSKNIKYFTVMINDDSPTLTGNQSEITLSSETPVFLSGGSDGDLSDAMFEQLVTAELQKYLDKDSEVMDTAINVESVFYDSGFSLNVKKEFANVIAVRKDIAVILTTHIAAMGNKSLSLSESRAIASALKTRFRLAPESTYFGTPVARAVIVGGDGILRNGSNGERTALAYDLCNKASRMMGASNGKWKRIEAFDRAPKSLVETLIDVKPQFIPDGIKPTLWSDGLVWAQPYDRDQYHFPAFQTIYEDDTSVLNSFNTIMCICTLSKVGDNAWRNFTGTSTLTDDQFKEAVTAYVRDAIKDRFADMFVIIPEVIITEQDKQRGYSWKLVCKVYANNMKTKMVYNSVVYRMSDLTA